LLVNKAGLEHAKSLIAGYKQGKIGEMNAELWSAKKIVDSTLHPGKCQQPRVLADADCCRYRRTSLPSLPNVVLRPIKFGRYGRNAHTRTRGEIPVLPSKNAVLIQYRLLAHFSGKLPTSPSMLPSTMRMPTNPPRYPFRRSHNHTFWLLGLHVL
jgi:hypothetical protein